MLNPNSINKIHHSPLGSSDHECLSFELKCYTEQYKQNDDFCKYNYKKADYTAINGELNEIHWDILLWDESIDINWNLFKSNVLAISIVSTSLKLLRNVFLTNLLGGLP